MHRGADANSWVPPQCTRSLCHFAKQICIVACFALGHLNVRVYESAVATAKLKDAWLDLKVWDLRRAHPAKVACQHTPDGAIAYDDDIGSRLLDGEEWNGFPWQIVPKPILDQISA